MHAGHGGELALASMHILNPSPAKPHNVWPGLLLHARATLDRHFQPKKRSLVRRRLRSLRQTTDASVRRRRDAGMDGRGSGLLLVRQCRNRYLTGRCAHWRITGRSAHWRSS